MKRLLYVKTNPFGLFGLVGIAVSLYTLYMLPDRPGLELYPLLPITWTICVFVFQDIIPYHKNGMGLKFFYATTVFRYLIIPILTCLAGDVSSPYGYFGADAYRYAIVMQSVELFICAATIKVSYEPYYYQVAQNVHEKNFCYDDISIGSLLLICGCIGLVVIRGVDKLLRTMRFGIVSAALDQDSMYGYDIWLAHTLMAVVVIVVIGKAQKNNDRKKSIKNIVLPIISVGLSCLLIFGNNRMMIVYFALSGLATLFIAFPEKKKLISATILPIMVVVLVSFTMVKQFRTDLRPETSIDIAETQETLTAYLTGTESIAKTYFLYGINGHRMSVLTFFSDIANKTTILGLPGFNRILGLFKNVPTSYKLAMIGSEIVPVAGQTLFYGGYVFGWLLDIAAYIVLMRLLCYFEIKGKLARRSGDVYLYTWCSLILGMSMCYSLSVIYNGFTYVPFFLMISLNIIRNIRFYKAKIRGTELNKITE